MDTTVECMTLYGEKRLIEAEKLIFRPAAYAIVMNKEKILLVNTKNTGKWFFPGGAIEKGEKMAECLKREVFEETGIAISVGELFVHREDFFSYDPLDIAYHNFSFIYFCTPETVKVSGTNNTDLEDEASEPEWVNIATLKPEQLQSFAVEVIEQLQ